MKRKSWKDAEKYVWEHDKEILYRIGLMGKAKEVTDEEIRAIIKEREKNKSRSALQILKELRKNAD